MGNCCITPETVEKNDCVVPNQKNAIKRDRGGQISIEHSVVQSTVYMLDTCDEIVNIIHGPLAASTPTRVNEFVDDFVSVSSSSGELYNTPPS